MYSYGNLTNDEVNLVITKSNKIKDLEKKYKEVAESLAARINIKYSRHVITKENTLARQQEMLALKKMYLDPITEAIVAIRKNEINPIRLKITAKR